MCRSLLAWNALHRDDPALWFVGRSRVEPEKNTVMIRTAFGLVRVTAGDTIVRRADGTFAVEGG